MNKYYLLIILFFVRSTKVFAEDYFDPSLLATDIIGEGNIDLSAFSRPGGGMEGEQEVAIYVNDEFYSRNTLFFRNTLDKGLLPEFTRDFLTNCCRGIFLCLKKIKQYHHQTS